MLSFSSGKPKVKGSNYELNIISIVKDIMINFIIGLSGKPSILHLPNNKEKVKECLKTITSKLSTY
jgi:hypothetical protein